MDGTIASKRHKPEEIVAMLRQFDVLTGQGQLSRSQTHSGRNGSFCKGFCFVLELGVGREIVRRGRRRDKSGSPVALQAPDRACLSQSRSVWARAAWQHFINDSNAPFGA